VNIVKPKPNPNLAWEIPLAAVELIADAEGLYLKAYRCPAGVPTIGWGQTDDVQMGMVWTKEEADADLCRSIGVRVKEVLNCCTRTPTDYELGAMVSLQYNIGSAAFAKSSVLKAHNRADPQAASRAFGLFNQATVNGVKQELRGLTARRAAEAALYLRPEDGSPPLRMPQAVEPSASLTKSPTVQASTVALSVGALGTLNEVGTQLTTVSSVIQTAKTFFVEILGIPSGSFLPVLLVLFSGVTLWNRIKQRIKGWA
jgi:lysozyme